MYVGHTDYKYLRWQVIDTPGILDHSLEERNVIEMQAVTALAHLRACVLYFMDLSEQCGHTVDEQVKLFESIKPLFTNKPLLIVANKIDIVSLDDLTPEKRACMKPIEDDTELTLLQMSNLNEEGVMEVKTEACERLLSYRIEQKMRTKKVDGVLNRLHVAVPKPRDGKERVPCIPESVLAKRQVAGEKRKRKLERDIEEEQGDDYVLDLKKHYTDIPEEERYDIIPEIWEGHNVADYIDPDIFEKLAELEREEDAREESGMYVVPKIELDDTMKEIKALALQIRNKKAIMKDEARVNKQCKKPTMPRTTAAKGRDRSVSRLRSEMETLGVDMSETNDAHFTKTKGKSRALGPVAKKIRTDMLEAASENKNRSVSRTPRNQLGVKDAAMQKKLAKIAHRAIAKKVGKMGMKGEADRFIGTKMPKHLYSGKRGIGSNDRR